MDHAPRDFHDIAVHHNFTLDKTYRLKLIEAGIFIFPLPVKQGSISFAHSIPDIEETLDKTRSIVQSVFIKKN
jgi:glutamate-1-semialdehyde 2,1-aminomutase